MGLLLVAAGLALISWLTWRRLDPLVRDMAVTEARNAVTVAMNRAIAEAMSEGKLQYASLVQLEKDDTGVVTAVVTNMSYVNQLKASLTNSVIREIRQEQSTRLGIPLGNLLGGKLLSGRGPRIPVEIMAVSQATADLESSFQSAGINQTLHRIRVCITAEVFILIPGGTVSGNVRTQVTVAETVLVGRVPESYMYFESDDNWDEAAEQYDILS